MEVFLLGDFLIHRCFVALIFVRWRLSFLARKLCYVKDLLLGVMLRGSFVGSFFVPLWIYFFVTERFDFSSNRLVTKLLHDQCK